MSLSRVEFSAAWSAAGEDQAPHVIDTAWERYQYVQQPSYATSLPDISAHDFQATGRLAIKALQDHHPSSLLDSAFLTLPANRIPWTPTGVHLAPGQTVSTFAVGRVWRSKILDLYLGPQSALWFKIGVDGRVFNSTGDTNTFSAIQEGELYVATQFPNRFAEPDGGRLVDQLATHHSVQGAFEIMILVWAPGIDIQATLCNACQDKPSPTSTSLLAPEVQRIRTSAQRPLPPAWTHLWFLGATSTFTLLHSPRPSPAKPHMHCRPSTDVSILQFPLRPCVPFTRHTTVSWSWLLTALPSRLREDTTFTHDYLSVAFEFESGRDVTYTWSCALPSGFGYWCPLPGWRDREYHIVVRSGVEGLGEWMPESRNLHDDYVRYVLEGDVEKEGGVPRQITKVWFIAGNVLQRLEGEMEVRELKIGDGTTMMEVL